VDQPGRLVEWLSTRTPVYAWVLPGKWYDIGTPEQLETARAYAAVVVLSVLAVVLYGGLTLVERRLVSWSR